MDYLIGSVLAVRVATGPCECEVRNDGPDSVVVSRSAVELAPGALSLPAGESDLFELGDDEGLFAQCGSGHSASVAVS